MYFDIYKSTQTTTQPYWLVAKGNNNETLCQSEMLSTKADAKRTIRAIMDGAALATVYDETGELGAGLSNDQKKIRV
jgi:uncharacterized protein YegP (UPF0339 family)